MRDVNWVLMAVSFLLGLLLTLALTIRKVTREVPVTVSAAIPKLDKPDLGKVTGTAVAAGTEVAAGAAAKMHVAADKVERKIEHVEHILEKEPYGSGSIRVSARTAAPAGYTIKGDKDTGRYFTLDSPEYEAIEAEVWFANEESAAKAGFLRWDARGERTVGLISAAAETVITEQHVVAETVITEQHVTADSTLVIVDDGVAEARTVIVDDGIPETKIRIIGVDD